MGGLDRRVAVKWGDTETVMRKIMNRNNRHRIIRNVLYTRGYGNDPIHCWDGAAEEFVYVRKKDWLNGSPAIRTTEACIIMRITPFIWDKGVERAGVIPKRGVVGQGPDNKPKINPRKNSYVYYSVQDMIDVAGNISPRLRWNPDPAGVDEIRSLFYNGFTTYKKTKDGTFVPVWDETIF